MSIVSHTLESNTQRDGSTSNVLRMYDQDAREYMVTFFAPSGFNMTTKINATIAELEVQFAETEFSDLVRAG